MQSENDHARQPAVGERRDLTEVEVESEDDTSLAGGLREDLAVRQALQSFLTKMNRVVAMFAQPCDHRNRHAHVGEESHQLVSIV